MKLSLIYITARDAHCFARHPEWNQYKKLAEWLDAQTYRDFEVIYVTPFRVPRAWLSWSKSPSR